MKKAAVTLFEAAGLAERAPRPLADRLRPASLAEVIGQDHLLGEQGMLSRMVKAGRLASVIFWGPPGTGKTTVARLLADLTDLVDRGLHATSCSYSYVPHTMISLISPSFHLFSRRVRHLALLQSGHYRLLPAHPHAVTRSAP